MASTNGAAPKIRVAIVGGGIGGLSCALSLAGRKGKERASNVEVTVYEAAPYAHADAPSLTRSANSRRSARVSPSVSTPSTLYALETRRDLTSQLHKIGVLDDYLRVADPVEGVDKDTDKVWFEWSYGEKAEYDRICMTKVSGKNAADSSSGLTRCAASSRSD